MDNTPIGLKVNLEGIPYIESGDYVKEIDITTQLQNEIKNGILEHEMEITNAVNNEERVEILKDIFNKYPFIRNFDVVYYNSTGDFEFSYSLDFSQSGG